ncbi:MAG: hypothetical protein AABO41_15965 [Acidobacteriota bacterium]
MNKRYFPLATGVAGCLALLVLTSLAPAYSTVFAGNRPLQRTTIERVRGFSDISLEVDNSEHPAVSIQSANTKTINKNQFSELTGGLAASARYSACPTVRVINTGNQPVKAFALGLLNKRTGALDVLRIGSHPLEPGEEFVVDPLLWAKTRKKPTKTFIQKDGVTWEDKRAPDWNSEEMWLPGDAADFQIFVGEVEVSNGTRWLTKR